MRIDFHWSAWSMREGVGLNSSVLCVKQSMYLLIGVKHDWSWVGMR